jgi:hypothetical protein
VQRRGVNQTPLRSPPPPRQRLCTLYTDTHARRVKDGATFSPLLFNQKLPAYMTRLSPDAPPPCVKKRANKALP